MCIKFCELIFCVFNWQKNLWGINFCGHGSVVGTIIVGFASYCGLEAYHEIYKNLYTSKISTCMVYSKNT